MRIRIRTRLLLLTSAILLASFLTSPPQLARAQALSDPMPVDPQITIGKFANGMRYYVRANKKPEKRAELRLVVKAGSIPGRRRPTGSGSPGRTHGLQRH
jgi:zinc protease